MVSNNARLDPKTRKPLPEGIRYRADRNRYQVRVWAIGLNGEWRERSFLVPTLSEAKRFRAEAQTRIKPDGAMTLSGWHSQAWPAIRDSVRPSTARAYDVSWRKRVKPWLGHKKLEAITVGDIEAAIAGWDGSASTRIDALAFLSRLLDNAMRAEIIPLNLARLARRPRPEAHHSLRSRALTTEEVDLLIASIEDGVYRRYIAALAYTGMRAGEGAALKVGDVDLTAGVIHVRRSLSTGRTGQIVEQSPKSRKERTVPLPAKLRPHLTVAMQGKRRTELVFTGPRGGKLNGSNVRRAVDWKSIRVKLDREDLRIHDLRHTLATMLFDAGAAANDVQAVLGHSSMQVTEKYSRARADVAVRAGRALDQLFSADERKKQGEER
ncbi:tyrosine-type recombinase/integrase [Microbacterium bovistercoris]|uniref:tyrosine-type recombinase/integrase n=1 Tax=Microbacterium bovistercoris TaxID=2293570 RepID=UPI0015F29EB0|nr:site-specific integrase [Microbacterium bovistercoris]